MDREKMAIRLKELRLSKGETQAKVAKSIGTSVSAYSMYEIGARIPRDDIKVLIAKHFDTSVSSIFF